MVPRMTPPEQARRAAVVLAAGKGTRMKSALSKVLHLANGRPLVSYPVERALALEASPVVVVVGHQAEEVRAAVEARFPGAPLAFAVQAEQLGTAHAVLQAKAALAGHEGRVLVLYGDVPLLTEETLARLVEAGRQAPVAFLTMRPKDPTGYGRVVRDASGACAAIVEHKDATPAQRAIGECNAGIYDCDATFLWRALAGVGASNAQRELYLTDVVAAAARAGTPAIGLEAPVEELAGVNDKVELAAVGDVLRRRAGDRLMRAGAIFVDPASTFVEDGVEIGADAVIEPNVRLTGRTSIGAGARIGFGSVVEASVVADGAVVKPYCVLEEAVVGARATVGPFARLRPGTELAEEVHVGNFVETKKTRMGKGSKANHLSYLGDATIGERCNIGAGTITCNYDGVHKHPTVLGDEVFIGSDSQLVAPVTLGDGAYVGAGTTVTEDVPPLSLAISRAPQVVKEGWVAKKREARKKVVKPTKNAASRRAAPRAKGKARKPAGRRGKR